MAPLQWNTVQAGPHIAVRQNAASPNEITLTVAHPSTTYTSTVNLGASTAATTPTAVPFPLSTSDPSPTAQIVVPHNDSSDSGLVAGATIGAIFGFLVLVVLLYKCCIDNRSAIWVPPFYTSYDDSDSEFGSSRGSKSSRVRRRGGDGGWSKRNRKGDRVMKPPRARVKHHGRHRDRSESSDESRGTSRRRGERRVSGATRANNNGLIGWYWASSGRPKGRYHNYDHRRDVWGDGKGMSIDD